MIEEVELVKIDDDIKQYILWCLEQEHSESYLINILHKVQQRYGYLCEPHMDEVAHTLQVPTATVSGVATFYHYFRLKPPGKYQISVCMGTACFIKGADRILKAFETELGIHIGDTTSDRLFSIEQSRCLGVCAMAPLVAINEQVFGNVTPKKVSELIHKVTESNK
jgi:NADH:ubiquinone oxidoreductase subunit E